MVGEGDSRSLKELVVYTAAFTGPLAGNAVLALVGTLADEWSVTEISVLLSIPAFMFPFAAVQLFSGIVSEAYNREIATSAGLLVYVGGSFMCAFSPGLDIFLVARIVQGVGYAFVNPMLLALLSDVAGPKRQGIAMGFYGSSTGAGVAAGPLLAGALAEVDWRMAFVVIGLLALGVLVALQLLFGKGEARGTGRPKSAAWQQLVTALKDRDVALLSSAGFLAFFGFVGIFSFISVHLTSPPFELDPAKIGLVLSVSGLTGIVLSPVAGRLVDAVGPRCCVAVGYISVSATSFTLVFADQYSHFLMLLAVSGAGGSFVWSSLLTMLMRVNPELKGTSSSVFNSARFTGYAFSPLFLAPVYMQGSFAAVAVACGALALMALALASLSSSRLNAR